MIDLDMHWMLASATPPLALVGDDDEQSFRAAADALRADDAVDRGTVALCDEALAMLAGALPSEL